jgi:hypothetical protein
MGFSPKTQPLGRLDIWLFRGSLIGSKATFLSKKIGKADYGMPQPGNIC